MRFKPIALFAGVAVLLTATMAYPQYQTKVYHDNGGDRIVVDSGGSIDVLSGGAIKVAGTDRTTQLDKAVISGTAGKKIVGGAVSLTGSSTVATGLTTVDYAVGSLKVLDDDHGALAVTWSAGNVTVTTYGIGTSTVSTTPGTATYYAVGTP